MWHTSVSRMLVVATSGAALSALGCDPPTAPYSGELESLAFAQSQVAVGAPVVLTGAAIGSATSAVRVGLQLTTSSGASLQAALAPWKEMTDAEILAVLGQAGGRATLGFKEVGQSRGVDASGRVLVSPATVERMKAYIRSQGLTITYEYDMPAVAAQVPLDLAVVTRLRSHPNVDYLEPIIPGTYLSVFADGSPTAASAGTITEQSNQSTVLATVVPTTGGAGAGLRVRSGDVITATYRRADGEILSAVATVQ